MLDKEHVKSCAHDKTTNNHITKRVNIIIVIVVVDDNQMRNLFRYVNMVSRLMCSPVQRFNEHLYWYMFLYAKTTEL